MENEGMMFITGIEDTFVANQDAFSNRSLDEYELTGHYAQFETDLQMIASVGFPKIRYGIPWYLVHPEPKRFDWSWVDRAM
ncbi:MAG TPA: glycoside hydrolase family 1 protein, partial [Thermotogota bacterium]|nr:glycoside hydrolase family 1 protein [Thermotogota bacterium]